MSRMARDVARSINAGGVVRRSAEVEDFKRQDGVES